MKKNFSKAIAIALVFVPGLALAASDDVQLGVTDTVLSVNGATVTVAGTASTTVESIVVNAGTFDLTFAAGSKITVSAPDITITSLSAAQSIATDCASGVRTTTITAVSAGTATIEPSATACSTAASSSGGGGTISGLIGGGGGGGSTTIIPTQSIVTPAAASAASVTFSADFGIGDENGDVAALQSLLETKRFLTMPIGVAKGYFGALTRTAVKAYQQSMGITPVTGYVGPKTRASLNVAETPAAPTPSTSGASAPGGAFTRDLETGMTGDDVQQLQIFLNTHGFVVADSGPGSPGNETTKFGALTRAALAKFQAGNNITPSVGYFGPKTRAAVHALMGM